MLTDKTAANTFAQLRTGSVLRLRQNFFSSYLVRFLNKLTIFSPSCSLFADQPEIQAERPHVHSGPGHPFQLCCRFMDKNHTSRSFWFFCVLSGCFVVFQNVYKSFAMRADLDQHSHDHQLTWKGCEQDLGPKCLGCVTVGSLEGCLVDDLFIFMWIMVIIMKLNI